ncbi:MAG: hypothetical protein AB7O24_29700 [Kofleriaceae bacterium]
MRYLLAVLVLSSGCSFYFDDDDDICEGPTTGAGAQEATPQYRDPLTGVCQNIGWSGCDPRCGECPDTADQAFPDWASCYGTCEGRDEGTCLATSGCRAIYNAGANGNEFYGCWGVAPSGPVQGGGCTGLDAYQCSRHDDCAAYYYPSGDWPSGDWGNGDGPSGGAGDAVNTPFQYCAPEPIFDTCNEADPCLPGSHCEQHCYGPNGDDGPGSMCIPVCVPDVSSCAMIDCGPGYECVDSCTPSGGLGPPVCEGMCVATTACEALATEMECTALGECTPVYEGEECTCYPNGCSCEILTYERCESQMPVALPPAG